MSFVLAKNWLPKGVTELEPAAMTALRISDENVTVVASAGAGKTEFLAQKAAYLLETGLCPAPKRILAISFKRDAAKNLVERVRQRCLVDMAKRFDSLTFDAFTKSLVDRFGAAIPAPYTPAPTYSISVPRGRDWDDFLRQQGAPNQSGEKLSGHITNTSLPINLSKLPDGWKRIVDAYWGNALRDPNDSRLAFPMLNRLAEFLLRENKQVCRALRLTYSYIFLDEFQDTTSAQYQLLTTAFLGSNAKLTAVGDDKQRIMGWAGAMNDGFRRLKKDFKTTEMTLLSNWRSHADLVAIQHVIAQAIDEDTSVVEARAERSIDGDIAAIWNYDTQTAECEGISDWIANQVQIGVISADQVAILVRMKADNVETELAPAFERKGLILRNVARNVGEIAIQDLLTEELTEAILPLLKLGARQRSPDDWLIATKRQEALRGVDPEDEDEGAVVLSDLDAFVLEIKNYMCANTPSKACCDVVFAKALNFLNETVFRGAVSSYSRDRDYMRVKTGFKLLLQESSENANNWNEVLDRFEGVGQTPLMTVHKSKGLEFHTMIFFGLDSKSWWSLKPNSEEEMKSFFVAFTRAMQRAFFTRCAKRGDPIGWIEKMLKPAGVRSIPGESVLKTV